MGIRFPADPIEGQLYEVSEGRKYRYTDGKWKFFLSTILEEDFAFTWGTLQNKPTSTIEQIDTAAQGHTALHQQTQAATQAANGATEASGTAVTVATAAAGKADSALLQSETAVSNASSAKTIAMAASDVADEAKDVADNPATLAAAATAASAHAAMREVVCTFPGTLATTTGINRKYFNQPITLKSVFASLGESGAQDVVVTIKKNGLSIGTVTVTASQNLSSILNLNTSMIGGDYLTLDLIATGGKYLAVTFSYELN